MYGLVILDIGPSRVGARGRLIPVGLGAVREALSKAAHAALKVLFLVRRTIPTPWLWRLAGLHPYNLLDREKYKWRNRVQTLSPGYPLWRRLHTSSHTDRPDTQGVLALMQTI